MSTKIIGVPTLAFLLLTCLTGCAHQLAVLNLGEYHSVRPEIPASATVSVLEGDVDSSALPLVEAVAAGMARSGVRIVGSHSAANEKPADLVAKIGIKARYDGSGTNFWINFPGFLIWTPAWNGYVYKAEFDVHVDLARGSDPKTIVGTLDLPIKLDIRHAEMDRTWTEVSWLEVGVIALVGGIMFQSYDTDVTPILMKEIERPIGEYLANRILQKFPAP